MTRKYELGRRAESMASTRERIVTATIELHAEQGIVATSYKNIAERADVGLGTVYHHFPTVDDLIMACGGRLLELTRPPSAAVFAGLRSKRARVQRLVEEVFSWYERYPQWRRAIADRDTSEALRRGVARRDALLREVTEAALGADTASDTVLTVMALLNFEVYRTLVDAGASTETATQRIARVIWTCARGRSDR